MQEDQPTTYTWFKMKLTLVPLIFLSLRVWGSLRMILNYSQDSSPSWLKTMQTICDPAQVGCLQSSAIKRSPPPLFISPFLFPLFPPSLINIVSFLPYLCRRATMAISNGEQRWCFMVRRARRTGSYSLSAVACARRTRTSNGSQIWTTNTID